MDTYSLWFTPVSSISLGIVGLLIVVQTFRLYKWFTFFQNLPGAIGFSLLYGNLHMLPKTPEGRLMYFARQIENCNTKFHRLWVGALTPVIFVYHPEPVKRLLQSSAPKSHGFGSVFELVRDWIGDGLVGANGAKWARTRKLLTPAFHFDILKQYVHVYNQGAEGLMKHLDKYAETGDSFDVCPPATLMTFEVILKCAFGYKEDIQSTGHPYSTAVLKLLDIFNDRYRKPWLWPSWVFRLTSNGRKFRKLSEYVHKFADDSIKRRREILEREGPPTRREMDFLDILLTAKDENGNSMSDTEIRTEVDTFMFAGHDTTASAISWCLYTLAQHQEYQERIQEEVDAIFYERNDEEIKWTDIPKLQTLSLCLKEAMRLFPPVPFVQRKLNEELEFDGQLMPEGTVVTVSLYHLHRNPAVWDHPEEYRPERFLAENKKSLDPFAYLPFSAGSRNCIGQTFATNELKVVVGRILRRYKIRVPSDRSPPTKNPTIILRAENGIWLTLERREDGV